MKTTTRLATLAAVLALSACASAPKKADVVWPPPPEKPRIKFVESFAGSQDLDLSGWTKFKRNVFGGGENVGVMQPMGLALSDDGQRLYIADFQGNQILLADFTKKTLERFAPETGWAFPFNVALDAEENVYVSDQSTKTIRVVSRSGQNLRELGRGEIVRPTGLALDKKRRILYVADSAKVDSDKHRVLAYTLEGRLLREIGSGRGSDDAQFNFPTYLALDADGNLYVADSMNFRIQVFDADGLYLAKYGEAGSTVGSFSRIKGIAHDRFGNVYVVDAEHGVVQLFNKQFQPLMWFGGFVNKLEYFDLPSCIAIHPATNRIYVCNQHNARINVYELVNTTADDSIAPPDFDPDAPPPAPAASANASPAR